MQQIRQRTNRVRYIYILRKTADPNEMEFVADADSLDPDTPVDLNGDGQIDDSDALTHPGDPYDVKSFPAFQRLGFVQPFVDAELSHDQWGTFLSGTAPIGEPTGSSSAQYLIGIDVDVSDFLVLTNLAVIPFVLYIVFLLFVLTALTVALRQMWKYQVRLLAEIDRQKDELLGIVSHQMGGPITSLHWSLESMLDGDFGTLLEPQRKNMSDLLRATENLNELASLLLEVSRIQLGRMKMTKRYVDLSRYLTELISPVTTFAKEKGVNFTHSIPQSLPEGWIDPRLTRMTVENLLMNAVKYTQPGGHVELSVAHDHGILRCRVADDGVGIPVKDQPHIFEKLYRASNVTQIEGNGFGLYVAKGACEQQGGHLTFESTEGKGTRFLVELPIKEGV